MKTKIIYEDQDVLVVSKPAGLATQTARPGQPDMVSELKNYLARNTKGVPYLGLVHRLDQPVEGLLVLGKNKVAAASLSAQLAQGTLNKDYLAVVCGKPESDQGKLVDYLYKAENNTAQVVTAGHVQAKQAVLEYRVASELRNPVSREVLSLIEVHIETGRFHQIRVQMAHAGLPLLGDTKYAPVPVQELSRQLGIRQVALCARSIVFTHPTTGKVMSYTIEPENPAFVV